jgi:FkbM family methyltransferase
MFQKKARAVATVDRKRNNRGIFYAFLVASITVFVSKQTLVPLDQFLVTRANNQFVSRSYANVTNNIEHHIFDRRSDSSLVSKQSTSYPPLSCSAIFYEDRNTPRPFGDPNEGGVYARYTKTNPSFWVSMHQKEFDPTRWSIMIYGYYYENLESESFMNIIRAEAQEQRRKQLQQETKLATNSLSFQPLRVIDVGGNIGWYTLVVVAAAIEQQHPIIVDVFEPNPRNHRRLCESLFFNEWLRHDQIAVNLYPVGVTSNRMADKSSTGRLDVTTSGRGSLDAMNWQNISGTVTFPLVSLDRMSYELEWTAENQTISILKVDVEGFELEVFQGAQQFLKSKTVQNVFFEGNIRTELERGKFKRIAKLLLNCGYAAYKIGGFRGANEFVRTIWTTSSLNLTSLPDAESSVAQYMSKLLIECEGRRKKRTQCNIWWRPL